MMTWSQWGLQDALSPVMEEFLFFNDFTMIVLSFITTFVMVIILSTMVNSYVNMGFLEGQMIECVWTLIPAMVLIQIAVPSLTLLYLLDENQNTQISLKAVGHQWYWSYEYSDMWSEVPMISFDSYMVPQDSEDKSIFRLLDTDNRTTLPYDTTVRMMITSADVLHSWTVPSLGVKVDACPGRLNQLTFMSYRPGLYFGQCSEICGANHSFMPICLEFVSPLDFFWWIVNWK